MAVVPWVTAPELKFLLRRRRGEDKQYKTDDERGRSVHRHDDDDSIGAGSTMAGLRFMIN